MLPSALDDPPCGSFGYWTIHRRPEAGLIGFVAAYLV